MKIGFFDSGVGGLLILRATQKLLPQYEYLYYGDTAHVPYGDRSEEEIYELTKQGVAYLFAHDCALVIIACNTASAESLRKLQDTYMPEAYPDRKLLGVVIPTIEELVANGTKQALLIATKRTVESGKYPLELEKRNITHLKLDTCAVPGLVPRIERGEVADAVDAAAAIIGSEGVGVETVVLGCTHYVVMKNALRTKFSNLTFMAQDELIPQKLARYLMRHPEIEATLGKGGSSAIYLTDDRKEYRETYERLLAAGTS